MRPLPHELQDLMHSATEGMNRAMDAAKPGLMARAQAIAAAIRATLQAAFAINGYCESTEFTLKKLSDA